MTSFLRGTRGALQELSEGSMMPLFCIFDKDYEGTPGNVWRFNNAIASILNSSLTHVEAKEEVKWIELDLR